MPKTTLPAPRKSSALLTKDRSTASQFTLIADLIIQDGNTGKQQTARFVSAPQNGPIPENWQHAVQQMGAHALIDKAAGPCLHYLASGQVNRIDGRREYQPLPSHLLEKNKPYKESDSIMNEIIKINQSNWNGDAVQTVNARELHKFLESQQRFADWIKNRIEKYRFIEGQDFIIILGKSVGGRPSKEYYLTLDMAKELAMVENNDKGREARRYFIECEKQLRQVPVVDMTDPRKLLDFAKSQIERAEQAEAKYQEVLPTVQAMEILEGSEGAVNLTIAAKELNMPPRRFNNWLLSLGWIFRSSQSNIWQGYQTKIAAGYLEHKPYTYQDLDGFNKTKSQVLVTAKGRAKLAKLRQAPGQEAA